MCPWPDSSARPEIALTLTLTEGPDSAAVKTAPRWTDVL